MKNATQAGFWAAHFADSITHAKMNKVLVLFAEDGAGLGDRVSTQLKARGFDVSHGDPQDDISALTATVVVWTPGAAANENICAIARHEKAERRLVPVAITSRDAPSGFEDLPPIQLQGWAGDANDPRWRFVLDEVGLASGDQKVVEHLQQRPAREFTPYALRGAGAVGPRADEGPIATRPVNYAHAKTNPKIGEVIAVFLARIAQLPRLLRQPQVALPVFATILLVFGVTSFGLGLGRGKSADGEIAAAEQPVNSNAPVERVIAANSAETDVAQPELSANFVQPVETQGIAPQTDETALAPASEGETAIENDQVAPSRVTSLADGERQAVSTLEQPPLVVAERSAEESESQAASSATPPGNPSLAAASRPVPTSTIVRSPAGDSPGDATAVDTTDDDDDLIAELAWSATTAADAENAQAEFIGNYFKECLDCPSMAVIAPDPADESTAEFAISVRPVSGAEWRACVADGVCAGGRAASALPVSATYGDVLAYTAWLSSKTGGDYRAPSAAEWAMSSATYYGVRDMRALETEWWVASGVGGTASPGAGAARRPFRVVRILY